MSQYGQFCPVAKAMELLDERWTMLIVRELIAGSHTFGDLQLTGIQKEIDKQFDEDLVVTMKRLRQRRP